ncbi:MAG: sugar phosphate isomerase/epimerase [Lentisphaeria bacterium]|nr:sugar phosphate isomerase/epimerase [Lentisphaeria bacterium]
MKFSINTNGLRKYYTPAQIVQECLKAGVDGIEWGLNGIGTAEKDAAEMRKVTEDAGLEILSYINAGILWKTDEIRRWSEAVLAGGGKILRVAHPWFAWDYNESLHQPDDFMTLVEKSKEGLAKLMELGKEYKIRYVLETHKGSCFASPLMVPLALKEFDPRYCGVIYDPANAVLEGFVLPRIAVEVMKEYIAYIHTKNLMFKEGKTPDGRTKLDYERRTLDKGAVDYVELMFALKLHNWDGWFSFEEFVSQDPALVADEVKKGIEHLKWCRQESKNSLETPFLHFNY